VDQEARLGAGHAQRDVVEDHLGPAEHVEDAVAGGELDARLSLGLGHRRVRRGARGVLQVDGHGRSLPPGPGINRARRHPTRMDSMLGGMLGLAWLPAVLGVALVVAGVILAARMLAPGTEGRTRVGNIILTALAILGGVSLVAALALGTMHLGLRCC